jgi:hypothetical protein
MKISKNEAVFLEQDLQDILIKYMSTDDVPNAADEIIQMLRNNRFSEK